MKLVFIVLVLLMFAILITPAKTWLYQDGTPEDTKFEKFGPRADRLLIKMYATPEAEWVALEAGEIDITDFPVSKEYYDKWTGQPYNETINVIPYGAEYGFVMLDINNNNDTYLGNPPNPAYPNPVYPNPCSAKEMRQAIAHLVDRNQLDTIIGSGFYDPVYTPEPLAMSVYIHPEIRPGGTLEELAYPYSRGEAESLLDAGGFPVNPETEWRFWDRNKNGVEDPEEDLKLKFFIRNDLSDLHDFGDFLVNELNAVNVQVYAIYGPNIQGIHRVMIEKDFHLFTSYRPKFPSESCRCMCYKDEDYHYFHSDMYWHPGVPSNWLGITIPSEMDDSLEALRSAATHEEAITSAYIFQEVFAENAISVPLWSYHGCKAMSRRYVGTPGIMDGEDKYEDAYWEGIVNMPGYGIDSHWSFFNMHPKGHESGDGENMIIRWGYHTSEIVSLNPIYAPCPICTLETRFLLVYESLLKRDPYESTEHIPWLAVNYTVGTYDHPIYGTCSKVNFTLRPDVRWADGTPLTAADVYFTMVELDDILASRNLPPPWWKSNVMNILDFKMSDPYNFEVLFDRMSFWAQIWVGSQRILPKHVWKPLCESGDPEGFAPDPNMIGSGPYRFAEYVEGSHVLLVANRPNSTVTTNIPDSTPVTSPRGWFRWNKGQYVDMLVDGAHVAKFDAGTYQVDVAFANQFLGGPITIDLNITIAGALYEYLSLTIATGGRFTHSSIEVIEYGIHENSLCAVCSGAFFCKCDICLAVHIGAYTTIKEDIAGSTFYDDTGLPGYPYKKDLPTPDLKVDIKDVALAAKAFGGYPGHERWSTVADINNDCKIDIRDVAAIAKMFGWVG